MNKTWAAGIIGGLVGALIGAGSPVVAQMFLDGRRLTLRREGGAAFLDAADLSGQKGSALCFYREKNKAPLCMGTYAEDGLPFIALGENPRVQAIFRLAGKNQSGVLVFKDKGNHDRMILGLAMDDPNEDPFLATFDKSGKKKVHFGQY